MNNPYKLVGGYGSGLPESEHPTPSLKSGGGDGTFGDMEARVKRLEDGFTEIKAELKALRDDSTAIREGLAEIKGKLSGLPNLSELKGRVDAMPTSWQMWSGIVLLAVASWGAVLTLMYRLAANTPK